MHSHQIQSLQSDLALLLLLTECIDYSEKKNRWWISLRWKFCIGCSSVLNLPTMITKARVSNGKDCDQGYIQVIDLHLKGTQQQALHAIKHLQRILHKKHTLFLRQTARRRPIPNLEKADLSTFIDFTFSQISEKQIKYAKKNLEIFLEFVPYTSSELTRSFR